MNPIGPDPAIQGIPFPLALLLWLENPAIPDRFRCRGTAWVAGSEPGQGGIGSDYYQMRLQIVLVITSCPEVRPSHPIAQSAAALRCNDCAFGFALVETIKWLIEYMQTEGRVIRDAPVPFAIAVLIVFCLAFIILDWHFDGLIETQKGTIESLRERVESLKDRYDRLSQEMDALRAASERPRAAAAAIPEPPAKPDLRLSMAGANVFVPDAPDVQGSWTGIALQASVWNVGAPSVVTGWSLSIIPPNSTPVLAQLTAIPEELKLSGQNNNAIIRESDALDTKTATTPVSITPISGQLLFYVVMPRSVVLEPGTRFQLEAKDVFGHETIISQLVGDWLHR